MKGTVVFTLAESGPICKGLSWIKIQNVSLFFSFDYIVAGLAAIPYLLFTDVNYIDNPIGSGNFLNESAFCALLDPNIYPQVFFYLQWRAIQTAHLAVYEVN